MKKKNQKGFTLIELMIVVAIIGILAAIAIPNFIRYQLRSKQAEAKTVLGGIKTSQESFRAEYDNYVNVGAAIGNTTLLTTKAPWTPVACAGTCSRTSIATCTEFECIGYRPQGDVYFNYDVDTSAAGVPNYTTGATADLDGDATPSSFVFCTDNA